MLSLDVLLRYASGTQILGLSVDSFTFPTALSRHDIYRLVSFSLGYIPINDYKFQEENQTLSS